MKSVKHFKMDVFQQERDALQHWEPVKLTQLLHQQMQQQNVVDMLEQMEFVKEMQDHQHVEAENVRTQMELHSQHAHLIKKDA
jgi:hypothetical protein